MGRPLGPKSVRVGAKVRLEDSFEDQLQCSLHHAVADTGNLQRSDFAVALRDFHPAVRQGLVSACEKVIPHGLKKRGQPRGLDVLEALAIGARGTAVSFGDSVGLLKGLDLRDVHEQTPETMGRCRLRLSINPPSQFLQIAGCLCHLTPASLRASGILTGPGPSLRARFGARPLTVLRPDPSPWCLCLRFPLPVMAGISPTRFLRRAPRASPVST